MGIKNKIILVTGGAGFIGSHIVDAMIKHNCEKVIVYDNFSTGDVRNLKNAKESNKLKIIKADILDLKRLKDVIKQEGVDIISHHAAELEVFTGIMNPLKDMETNIKGTLNVLLASMDSPVQKIIYASSGAIYGQAFYLPEDENHPLEPHWPYGVSKLAGEKYCSMFHKLHSLPVVMLRYSIVYGPREWYGRVLTLFIKRVLRNKPPIIFGDGEQTRDFIYISDVVDANIAAMYKKNANGKAFNIGSGTRTSIKDLANIVIKCANKKIRPIFDNPKEGKASKFQPTRKRLIGELRNFVMNINYAKKVLGFKPKISLEYGIKQEINWVINNPDAWKTIPRV
ncbi:MAG: NAD-dependent epimerase/dehydratase family protein [Candidatus Parvarchaeota archaeon]|nr:NAD-dependent epimerase/dehydratase family protein [Candidatus Jingweiarchaeum tengchongense]MCW1310748.1 NAD-dependent epimerase/dehydratase family protein [Candidatus Jingweiarchaeum tengchongense]